MKTEALHRPQTEKALRTAARVAGLAALVWIAAAVSVWFNGPQRWKLIGIKIMIDDWDGMWWYATIADVAESVDIAPTLLDYALGVTDYPSQGRSLRPAIDGAGHTDQLAFGEGATAKNERHLPIYSVVGGNRKLLVVDADGGGPVYDLDRDWDEMNDLRPAQPDVAARLVADYQDWLRAVPYTAPSERKLSADERRTLKALGYIDN